MVDPRQPQPNKSSYAITVKLNAQKYHDHAMATYNDIRTERESAVTVKLDRMVFQDPGSPYIDFKDRYAMYDSATETYGRWHEDHTDNNKKFHSGKPMAEADRMSHITNVRANSVRAKLVTEFGDPEGTAILWDKLTKQPIPPGAKAVDN